MPRFMSSQSSATPLTDALLVAAKPGSILTIFPNAKILNIQHQRYEGLVGGF